MSTYNPVNERIKKEYFRFLREADRRSDSTIDSVRKAISRFEIYTSRKDFKTFNKEQAIAFKRHLASIRAERGGEPLAKNTLVSTTNSIKAFFRWLSSQPGYRSRINVTHIEYFNLSEAETRAAKAPRFKTFPTLEQIRAVIFAMPSGSGIERRDRALITFTILSGMRDGAMASLRLKHIDLARMLVLQDPREVKTKRGKRIDTFFFPVGADLEAMFVDWVRFLREELLFGNDDPVFPRTRIGQDANFSFAVTGIERVAWANAQPIREVFRLAFERVALPYFRPHSFRDTLVHVGERVCPTIEHFKAWSQNLGHEHVSTTLTSYGRVSQDRQGELVRSVSIDDSGERVSQTETELLDEIRRLIARGALKPQTEEK